MLLALLTSLAVAATGVPPTLEIQPDGQRAPDSDGGVDVEVPAEDSAPLRRVSWCFGQTPTWVTERVSIRGACAQGSEFEWLSVTAPGAPKQQGVPRESGTEMAYQVTDLYLWRLADVRAACRGKAGSTLSLPTHGANVRFRCAHDGVAETTYRPTLRVRCLAPSAPSAKRNFSVHLLNDPRVIAIPERVNPGDEVSVEVRGGAPGRMQPLPTEAHLVKLDAHGRVLATFPTCFRWEPFLEPPKTDGCTARLPLRIDGQDPVFFSLWGTYLDGSPLRSEQAKVEPVTAAMRSHDEELSAELHRDVEVLEQIKDRLNTNGGQCDDALVTWIRALPGVTSVARGADGDLSVVATPGRSMPIHCHRM